MKQGILWNEKYYPLWTEKDLLGVPSDKTVLNYGLPRPGQDLNPIEDPDSETLNDEPRECQSDQRPTSSKGGPGEPYS